MNLIKSFFKQFHVSKLFWIILSGSIIVVGVSATVLYFHIKNNNTAISGAYYIEDFDQEDYEEELNENQNQNEYRTLYAKYIDDNIDLYNYGYWQYVYLDDDEIPELVLQGNCEADGFCVLSVQNEEVKEYLSDRLDLRYIPRSGILLNLSVHMGVTRFFKTQLDGDFKELIFAEHFWGEDGTEETFSINRSAVSKSEYEDAEKKFHSQMDKAQMLEQYTQSITSIYSELNL